jgi:hypothetical protein
MDLAARFKAVAMAPIIQISNLDLNRQYPILWAELFQTACGVSVMLTLHTPETFTPRVVLPV